MQEILLLVMGRTKFTYDQLFVLNRVELDLIIEGHEIDIREQWEMNRRSALLIAQPHVKERLANKHYPLPWDKEIKVAAITESDRDQAKKLFAIQKKIEDGNS